MELSKALILDRIDRKEEEMERYRSVARQWDKMWKLDPGFGRSMEEAVRQGQEQVVLPTPFNVVNLGQRLLSSKPLINVPPTEMLDKEALENAQVKEQWLTAAWPRINQQQKKNVIARLVLDSLVRGRHVLEVKWIKEKLPKRLRSREFPILCRRLEPMNVGYEGGPYYTKWAYHRYETSYANALQEYPTLQNGITAPRLETRLANAKKNDTDLSAVMVNVTDMWYRDTDSGDIGNVLLVEDEYVAVSKGVKPGPHLTDYPDIPIIVGTGDFGPGEGDEFDGLSLLYPLMGTWEYQCRLVSQMATTVLWDAWPMRLIQNEFGEDVGDIEIGPGVQKQVPWGTRVEIIRTEANTNIMQQVFQQVDSGVQQATFPGVLYGEAPGDLQAGYGVSLLADAAKGRIKNFLESLEMTIAEANSMMLSLIEEFGGTSGVTVWGMSEKEKAPYKLTLSKKEIKGTYENEVVLTPQIPQDQIQKQTIGIRLTESGTISQQTNRDSFVGVPLPQDEEQRIMLEEALHSDELRPWRIKTAIQNYFKDKDKEGNVEWQKVLINTPLMPQPPEGYHWMPDGSMMKNDLMAGQNGMPGMEQGPMGPQGMQGPPGSMPPPQMGPPGGPPPGMGQPPPSPEMGGAPSGMPPGGMGPEMMQGPLPPQEPPLGPDMMATPQGPPPDMMGPPPPDMGGMPPDMGMGGPPSGGLPPGLPSPEEIAQMSPEQLIQLLLSLPPELVEQLLMLLPPELANMLRQMLAQAQGGGGMPPGGGPIAPPMGGGIPPQLQGQLTPGDLGMSPQADPALFGQVSGNPLPPQDELDQLAGLPPGGPPLR